MDVSITKRIHISGITPNISETDLHARLATFATVKALDGFGLKNALGDPRKFVYATLEGPVKDVNRCINVLSGSVWKGTKLRLGDARPDFAERISKEHQNTAPPKKRPHVSKYRGCLAKDMSLITAERAQGRGSWKVLPSGKLLRRMRMRPAHPLPPTLEQVALAKKLARGTLGKKRRRLKPPPIRARRRTIDVTRWGGERLTGIFLEGGVTITASQNQPLGDDDVHSSEEELKQTTVVRQQKHEPDSISASPSPAPEFAPKPTKTAIHPESISTLDLRQESSQSLGVLQSLFESSNWIGREELDSDIEVDRQLLPSGTHAAEDGDDFEVVPMDEDQSTRPADKERVTDSPTTAAHRPPQRATKPSTKLKDLFAPKEDEGQFSLLGHLGLDLEFDEEMALAMDAAPIAADLTTLSTHLIPAVSAAAPTLDPRKPMFFPGSKAGLKDLFHMDNLSGFYRTESEEEIRKRWEDRKGELTKGWKKRSREAGKVHRRRGGGGDQDAA